MKSHPFSFPYRVPYADCTLGNHIYYARYLDILEKARGEWFRFMGTTFVAWQEKGLIFPVIEVQLRYRAPARYDDLLQVQLAVRDLAKVRLVVGCRILRDETLLVEGTTTHVCTSLQDRLERLPAELLESLEKFREPPTN